ncbi:hypothetical protein [Brevundimonas sp.]
MSRQPPIVLPAVLTLLSPPSWAHEAALRGAMDTSVADLCVDAPEGDAEAMTVDVQLLPASALSPGAGAATTASPLQLGPYAYHGKGVRITSIDPRFAELRVDPDGSGPRLPKGDRLVIWNLVQATWAGTCRLALTLPGPPVWSQSRFADQVGARPVVQGYRAGVSQPFGQGRLIGLMHPETGEDRTLLISFSAGVDHRTRVEADLPLALQSVRTLAPIHGGPWTLLLIGRQSDGALVQLHLQADYPRP